MAYWKPRPFVWQIHHRCALSFIVYWRAKIPPFGKLGINNLWVIKRKGWATKGCLKLKQRKCNNALEECLWIILEALLGASWYFWVMLQLRVGLWSGVCQRMKTLRVQNMCESYDLHTENHRWTKVDWKQWPAVCDLCWGMNVKNSLLICLILFYEAFAANSASDLSAELFLTPPLWEPHDLLS